MTDVFPAFALATGEGDLDVLGRPPRDPREPLLGKLQWMFIVGSAVLLTAATLATLLIGQQWLRLDGDALVTLSFLTLAFAQLWHVFNMRGARSRADTQHGRAQSACVAGARVVSRDPRCYWPPLADPLHLIAPGQTGLGVMLALSLAPVVLIQLGMMLGSAAGPTQAVRQG